MAEFWALRDVSFDVKEGEVLGIIGRNGAGKSTLLKILSRITEPTAGRVALSGRVASLLEVGTGFHPELTGRENIFLNGAILGMGRSEIAKKFDEIVSFAEVSQFLDTPVKRYSSGMYVRLAFAVAAHMEPDILVVDEVLAVGDAAFQKKCLGRMGEVARDGRTVLFVSHNMAAVSSLTSRCIALDRGAVAFNGNSDEAIAFYVQVGNTGSAPTKVDRARGTHTTLIDARLCDADLRPTTRYIPGEPIRIEVMFETDGASRMSLEGILRDPMRNKLALASLHQFHGITLPLRPGRYSTLLELTPVWLGTGTYSFDMTTSVVNSHWDHYVESMFEFEVVHSNPGGEAFDFRCDLGLGAVALACLGPPVFAADPAPGGPSWT